MQMLETQDVVDAPPKESIATALGDEDKMEVEEATVPSSESASQSLGNPVAEAASGLAVLAEQARASGSNARAAEENATTDKAPANRTLPLSRTKRIIKQDDDILLCSNSAAYATTVATEMFIRFFSEQALLRASGDRRKKLTYQDFAGAVSSTDQLEFLSTLVPPTIPFGALAMREQAASVEAARAAQRAPLPPSVVEVPVEQRATPGRPAKTDAVVVPNPAAASAATATMGRALGQNPILQVMPQAPLGHVEEKEEPRVHPLDLLGM